MDGYQVATLDDVVETADIFITTTGNKDIIMASDMAKMKHQAIVGNIGHFDNEIDMAGLAKIHGIVKDEVKPQVHTWKFPDGKILIVLSEGRLLNLGNATGHPSFVMSNSFADQTLAQIELFTKPEDYPTDVYVLPKHLDEKVARLHLDALGVKLTTLRPDRPPTSASRSTARTSRTTTATDRRHSSSRAEAGPRTPGGGRPVPSTPPCTAAGRPSEPRTPCPAAAIRSTTRTTTPPSAEEHFQCAPGPSGWRYVSQTHHPRGDHTGSSTSPSTNSAAPSASNSTPRAGRSAAPRSTASPGSGPTPPAAEPPKATSRPSLHRHVPRLPCRHGRLLRLTPAPPPPRPPRRLHRPRPRPAHASTSPGPAERKHTPLTTARSPWKQTRSRAGHRRTAHRAHRRRRGPAAPGIELEDLESPPSRFPAPPLDSKRPQDFSGCPLPHRTSAAPDDPRNHAGGTNPDGGPALRRHGGPGPLGGLLGRDSIHRNPSDAPRPGAASTP